MQKSLYKHLEFVSEFSQLLDIRSICKNKLHFIDTNKAIRNCQKNIISSGIKKQIPRNKSNEKCTSFYTKN